jgi:serine/threonine protein kinase
LRVLQRISQGNPNLPTILELAAHRDEYLVVTNWIRGDNLQSYLDQLRDTGRSLPSPYEAIRLYRGLAHGLTHLHRRRNVVHADIKPENLILAKGPNRLVMIDFGSAWTLETSYRRVPGDGKSEHYAAPELQMDTPSGSCRSDQFSATVVAYYMLTGRLPYGDIGGKAGLPTFREDYERLYTPPSQRSLQRPRMPTRIWRQLDETIDRALALDPSQRFQTGGDWLEAVEDLYCEMRRKPQFNILDRTLMRAIERLQQSRPSRRAAK